MRFGGVIVDWVRVFIGVRGTFSIGRSWKVDWGSMILRV